MKQDEHGNYIELGDFLKFIGIAPTGGQAKIFIRAGVILVDGKIETQVRKKLRNGMIVEYDGKKFAVDETKLK